MWTDATRRIWNRENALYLVFMIVERLSQTWRGLKGGANLMKLILEGQTFKGGILVAPKMPELARTRS